MAFVKASTEYKRNNKADYGREKIEILYQDQWIVVINKPSGMLSVPYPGSKVRTAQSVLEEILRKQGTVNSKHKPYVVHRLDRDTSGVMMFALTEQAQKTIMDSWHTMVTERLYHAIGERPGYERNKQLQTAAPAHERNKQLQTAAPAHERKQQLANSSASLQDEGWITDALAQNAHNVGFVPKAGDRDKDGREFKTVAARTHYKMVEKGPTHILFELSLDTGKKNQIRAHLAAHGYPLAGDEEHRAQTDHFHRLCLHARTLEFDHPFTGEYMKFEVPEPEEWLEYVKRGDFKPERPVWCADYYNKKNAGGGKKGSKKDNLQVELGEKRLSRKDRAHMDFIQSGKKYR